MSGSKSPLTTRRRFMFAGLTATLAGTIVWSQAIRLPFDGSQIDPVMAHKNAVSGKLLLLDIRRPDEWAATGIGEGARQLDMRRDDFIVALDVLLEGDRTKPVALICARGVRSNRVSQRLQDAGFSNVIDVPEGMLGSSAGPGWLKRKLPLQFN